MNRPIGGQSSSLSLRTSSPSTTTSFRTKVEGGSLLAGVSDWIDVTEPAISVDIIVFVGPIPVAELSIVIGA